MKHAINSRGDGLLRRMVQRNLIYNTCWEDPRIDRELLRLDAASKVVMITSAGCNALNYLLDNPAEICCVDVNPRQNALLELKIAVIKQGNYSDFLNLFGHGNHPRFREVSGDVLPQLSPDAASFWHKRMHWFDPASCRGSLYYHGTAGTFAWSILRAFRIFDSTLYADIHALSCAGSLNEQRRVFSRMEGRFLYRTLSRLAANPVMLSLLGISRRQISMIRAEHPEGFYAFFRSILRNIATNIPMSDNYFWRVYFSGNYPVDCMPDYLAEKNFDTLRERIHRISVHDLSFSQFLDRFPGPYTHFILLDHQDWLADKAPEALAHEWELILRNGRAGSRILLRSAGLTAGFIPEFARARLAFHPALTGPLHATDRPGTYGSLHLATINAPEA